ncbi:MAG: flagellar motor switch protein FliG [Christensenellales bacterium]|jgi:flagellar motor switch protein FliG
MLTDSKISPREKAAILLISMGKNYSAKIYKYLTDEEIEQLTLGISAVRRVDPETRDAVLNEFREICLAQKYIFEGGLEYAKGILEEALGPERTGELIQKLTTSLQARPFDFFRRADSDQILNFIQNEHPQTIALVLSYLDARQSANVLSSLQPELQLEVVSRIATMGTTSPEYIKEAERILERKLTSTGTSKHNMAGGIESIVDILNSVDRGTEKHILESLEKEDEELANEIRSRLFVFEDIAKLTGQAVQRVLREVDNADLAVALKGATKEVSKLIFDNISKRLQEMIREDMELMGPVRVREVEESQQRIVNIVRKLEDEGEIIIARGGEDEVFV